jgi:hypothetical protein
MKPSLSKTVKAAGGKMRSRDEAAGSAAGTSPPVSPPRPDPNREWCVGMKGPVFLAMWNPLSLLLTILCSSLLGETVHLGR